MTKDIDRRSVLKASAWSVPVIAMAVAAPAAVASQEPLTNNRIRFTNLTATVGKESNVIYVNTKVNVDNGPASVDNLEVVITISRDGVPQTFTYPQISGWGNTGIIRVEFRDIPKGSPVVVSFSAKAEGVTEIFGQAEVVADAMNWWK